MGRRNLRIAIRGIRQSDKNMSRPSEKAATIAEELVDYVHPGMNRAAAIQEIAAMIDATNAELLEVVSALLNEAETNGPGSHAVLLNHLREIAVNYKPLHSDLDGQHELFTSETDTTTATNAVAGQMP
jgi:hypothetical protein